MTTLRQSRLGDSDVHVPVVGLGCNNFGRRVDAAGTARVVHAALDAGVTFFDTAELYGNGLSEEYLGRALQGRRHEAIIATKFGMPGTEGGAGGSRKWIEFAIDRSLRRLGTDHVDLYQQHHPDDTVAIEETLETLDELVRAGKVRAIGGSNDTGEQAATADRVAREHGWAHFVTAQNRYSLLHREEVEADLAPVLRRVHVGLLPFLPLENGLLTGKYRRGQPAPEGTRLGSDPSRAAEFLTDDKFDVVEQLEEFARQRGIGILDVAIGGLAAIAPVVSVIAGATTPEQVVANARAGMWEPTAEDRAEIDRITLGHAVV